MEENNSKEINLLQLISLFFDWLKKLGKSILNMVGYLLRLLYRQKIALIIVTIICVGIGQYLARPSARIYQAEAMAILYGPEAQTVKEVAKQLSNVLDYKKTTSLSPKLNLPDSITKNIVSFETFDVIDYLKDGVADKVDFAGNHSLSDTLNLKMKDQLYFRLKIKKISQAPQIQSAIINYLNTNSKLQSEFNSKKDEYKNRIEICNIESKRIDSLASLSYYKSTNQQIKFDNNNLLIGEQKKQLFYDDLIRLNDIRSFSEFKLTDFKQPIDLPSGFVVNPAALNGRVKYFVLSIVIGFALSLLLAGLIENLKKIITYLKN